MAEFPPDFNIGHHSESLNETAVFTGFEKDYDVLRFVLFW